jgi:hypothetical protein
MALSGQAVAFQVSRQSDQGDISVTGSDASLRVDRVFPVDHGTFNFGGVDANKIVLESAPGGSFTVSEQDAAFVKALNITADAGTFGLVGQDALKGVSEIGAQASFGLAGQDVTLTVSRLRRGEFAEGGDTFASVVSDGLNQVELVDAVSNFAETSATNNLAELTRTDANIASTDFSLNEAA